MSDIDALALFLIGMSCGIMFCAIVDKLCNK